MTGVLLLPAILQMLAMLADEGWYHRRRGLPKWERLGHPLDTLSVAACYGCLVGTTPGPNSLVAYVGLASFSCLFITKDELVHTRLCSASEHWLHAVLFVLHPIVFLAFGIIWWSGQNLWLIRAQAAATLSFACYQLLYWSVPWNKPVQSQIASEP
jgi:hypothetical protein